MAASRGNSNGASSKRARRELSAMGLPLDAIEKVLGKLRELDEAARREKVT